nr:hypothetical protein [Bacteroidota bacterium]
MNYTKITLLVSLSLLLLKASLTQNLIVSLDGHKLEPPDNNYNVIEIIDVREGKRYIGYVFDGSIDEIKPVNLQNELGAALIPLFKPDSIITAGNTPLIIKINKFQISDHGGHNGLNRILEINLDFYTKVDGRYYHEFIAGYYINSSAKARKQNIDEMITEAIEHVFIEFIHRMNNDWGYHKEAFEDELYMNSLDHESLMKTEVIYHRNCIYYTFNGFRDNLADTVTTFHPKLIKNVYKELDYHKFKFKKTKIDAGDVWGVCFNDKLYIQVGDMFIPVETRQNTFIIDKMLSFKKHSGFGKGAGIGYLIGAGLGFAALYPAGIFAAITVCGFSGSLVGAYIGALTTKYNYNILNQNYKVDISTGMPVPIDASVDQVLPLNKTELIFYTTKIKEQNINLYINKKMICSLKSKSFVSYFAPLGIKPTEICLESNSDNHCEEISADLTKKKYFEVILNKEGKVSLFQKKSESMKSSIDRRIENGKLERINPLKE